MITCLDVSECDAKEIERIFNDMSLCYKSEFGWESPKVDVSLGTKGCYHGRKGDIAHIMLPIEEYIDLSNAGAVFPHEFGHDIWQSLIKPQISADSGAVPLVMLTFNELFGDLNARYFGYGFAHERNPFKALEEYDNAFKGLAQALRLENRKAESDLSNRLIEMIDSGAPEKEIADYASKLYNVRPFYTGGPTILSLTGENPPDPNMFVKNISFIEEISELKQEIKRYADILAIADNRQRYAYDVLSKLYDGACESTKLFAKVIGEHSECKEILDGEKAYRAMLKNIEKEKDNIREKYLPKQIDLSKGFDRLKEPYDNDPEYQKLCDISDRVYGSMSLLIDYKQELTKKIINENMGGVLRGELKKQVYALKCKAEKTYVFLKNSDTKNLAEFVYNTVSQERYGKDKNSFDFPHEVGGNIALRLYDQGITPIDVARDPKKYLDLCVAEIKDVICMRLRTVSEKQLN